MKMVFSYPCINWLWLLSDERHAADLPDLQEPEGSERGVGSDSVGESEHWAAAEGHRGLHPGAEETPEGRERVGSGGYSRGKDERIQGLHSTVRRLEERSLEREVHSDCMFKWASSASCLTACFVGLTYWISQANKISGVVELGFLLGDSNYRNYMPRGFWSFACQNSR